MSKSKNLPAIRITLFYFYVWFSTVIFIAGIFWLATIPSISESISTDSTISEVVKILYKLTIYFLLNLIIYRAFIITLKNTVSRLSFWHSKKEKAEDFEFVLIIEILLVICSSLIAVIVAFIDELIQSQIYGRFTEVKDILIGVLGILISAVTVYTIPVIGELEVAIKHKLSRIIKTNK